MALTGYGFEDLSDGDPIPTGGGAYFTSAVITAGQTILAEADAAITGTMGCRLTNGNPGSVAYLIREFTGVGALSFAMELAIPDPPSSGQQRLLSIMAGAGSGLRLDHNSDGRILTRNAAGTTVNPASMSSAITVGTPVLVQIYVAKGTTSSDGQARVRMVRLDTDTELYDSGLLTNLNTATADYDAIRLGWSLTTNAAITTMDVDSIAIEDAPTSGQLIDAFLPAEPADQALVTRNGQWVPVEPFITLDGAWVPLTIA